MRESLIVSAKDRGYICGDTCASLGVAGQDENYGKFGRKVVPKRDDDPRRPGDENVFTPREGED